MVFGLSFLMWQTRRTARCVFRVQSYNFFCIFANNFLRILIFFSKIFILSQYCTVMRNLVTLHRKHIWVIGMRVSNP